MFVRVLVFRPYPPQSHSYSRIATQPHSYTVVQDARHKAQGIKRRPFRPSGLTYLHSHSLALGGRARFFTGEGVDSAVGVGEEGGCYGRVGRCGGRR